VTSRNQGLFFASRRSKKDPGNEVVVFTCAVVQKSYFLPKTVGSHLKEPYNKWFINLVLLGLYGKVFAFGLSSQTSLLRRSVCTKTSGKYFPVQTSLSVNNPLSLCILYYVLLIFPLLETLCKPLRRKERHGCILTFLFTKMYYVLLLNVELFWI
jgi:hypothetical protein